MRFTVVITQCWSHNKITFNHISHTGCMAIRVLQRTWHQTAYGIKEHAWVMFLERFSPQDKISGICHLSCSYQATEADSGKEKTHCSFHFIWPIESAKHQGVLVFQEWLSVTDRHEKHLLLVTLPCISPPGFKMKEIPASPGLWKTEL